MSILIKGMEMPKKALNIHDKPIDTETIISIKSDGSVRWMRGGFEYVSMPEAKAYELPPHGRLIDADALMSEIKDFPYGYRGMIANTVANMPTIIEAEEDS